MANERKTEALVRDKLRALGYNQPDNGITVEEQKSEIAKVKTLLSKASKNAKGNAGYPEFIISNRKDTAFLIVFECKPDVKKHESPACNKPVEYAVDGVLHYAKHLAKHYTVLAVAVSGSTTSSMKVSNFLIPAGMNLNIITQISDALGIPLALVTLSIINSIYKAQCVAYESANK